MTNCNLLVDTFERIRDAVYPAVNGLSPDELTFRPDDQSNSIAWLAWHLTRVQDEAVAGLSGSPSVWMHQGWFDRFALPLDPTDTGYGHDPVTVATVASDANSLLDYFEDVHRRTVSWVRTLDDAALDRVVDDDWDPPVTVAHTLVGVIADDLQHAGQAAYVRGVVQRR